jgi:hypothetical protein
MDVSPFITKGISNKESIRTGYIILGVGAALLVLFLIFTIILLPLWSYFYPHSSSGSSSSSSSSSSSPSLIGTRCTFRWSIFQSNTANDFCNNADEFPWFLFYVSGFFLVAFVVNYFENGNKILPSYIKLPEQLQQFTWKQ